MASKAMASKALLLLLYLTIHVSPVVGNAGLFAYYETAIPGLGGRGPSQWQNLIFPPAVAPFGNQCGGNGQQNGFGQSPIAIPPEVRDSCDADMAGFEFEQPTCTWDDLWFRILNNGVWVGRKTHNGLPVPQGGIPRDCTFGRMKIPGSDVWFNALQFHIHTSSEHSVDGKYYPAELHAVHMAEDGSSAAVFGTFIDSSPSTDDPNADINQQSLFERFLQGWEATASQTDRFCSANPNGNGIFTPNSVLTSRQARIQCPAIGSKTDISTIPSEEMGSNILPPLPPTDDAFEVMHSFYEKIQLTPNAGIYSYRGGLTTPPCTEIVNWNLFDRPMIISPGQMERLYDLILCFTEITTCRHATIANEFGFTNRPPQPLFGRTIIHRCPKAESEQTDEQDGDGSSSGVVSTQDETSSGEEQLPSDVAVPLNPAVKGQNLICNQRWCMRQPHWAILYPVFVTILGILIYFLLTRFAHFLPYTAIIYLLGMIMGIGIAVRNIGGPGIMTTGQVKANDQLSESIYMWSNMNAETLLLVFLPGLLFRDAFGLNVHLFVRSIGQCLTMAFPMVLLGACLLATVGSYVLPYGWGWSLSMTFGSILSATDPVAVSALLNEVGAPPRLKMHISGESLLNDGSALVFFLIFAGQFLYDLGIPGLGRNVDVASGFAMFFRMSLGAAAIGLGFGLALIFVLYSLKRRLNAEESIVQVTATISFAYICYYVADAICRTSGVIAVVVCGIMTKAFGSTLLGDPVMMDKFWVLVEHLLNTILFALGGVVWGTIISNSDASRTAVFGGKDWGYMILVYVLMMFIRTFCIAFFYPILSRIGLRTNWKESLFMSFGGLRGAVGIAMAIALDSELFSDTLPGDPRRDYTSQLFFMTGGMAFMTLFINGSLCGPILRKLGLAESSEARHAILKKYERSMTLYVLDNLLSLLGERRFYEVDFALVRAHVPFLQDLSKDDLKMAIKRNRGVKPAHEYSEPNLKTFLPFLTEEAAAELQDRAKISSSERLKSLVNTSTVVAMPTEMMDVDEKNVPEDELVETRLVFLHLLNAAYEKLISEGEIDVRKGLLVFTLKASLEITEEAVDRGEPLNDWSVIQAMSVSKTNRLLKNTMATGRLIEEGKNVRVRRMSDAIDRRMSEISGRRESAAGRRRSSIASVGGRRRSSMASVAGLEETRYHKMIPSKEREPLANKVHKVSAFVQAHVLAQAAFKNEYCAHRAMTCAERLVFQESQEEVAEAELTIKVEDPAAVQDTMSHLLCQILLGKAAVFVGKYVESGLLRETEADEYLEEIEHDMKRNSACAGGEACRKTDAYQSSLNKRIMSVVWDDDENEDEQDTKSNSNSNSPSDGFEDDEGNKVMGKRSIFTGVF